MGADGARRGAAVGLAGVCIVLVVMAASQESSSPSPDGLSESSVRDARLCFGGHCVTASSAFAQALLKSEHSAFLLGEKEGRKQAALELGKRDDVRLYRQTTLQDAIKERPGAPSAPDAGPPAPPWHSEWFKIFHRSS
jgi:hypothetical protein